MAFWRSFLYHREVKKCITGVVAILTFSFPAALFAYVPYIVSGTETAVSETETSRAFYGKLQGTPHVFHLSSDTPLHLYLNIMVPDVAGQKKDIMAAVIELAHPEPAMAILDGVNGTWTKIHDGLGNDDYLKGPEFKAVVPPGSYDIRVWSPNNDSAYVLIVGEKDSYSPFSAFHTLRTLGDVKSLFFGKSAAAAYVSPLALIFYSIVAIFLAVSAIAIAYYVRRMRRHA